MKFLCGNCRTKYQISDSKVQGKILTVRCKSCGRKMQVREDMPAPDGGTAVAAVLPAEVLPERQSSVLEQAFREQMGRRSALDNPALTSVAPVPADLDVAGVEWYVAIDGTQHGPYAYPELVSQVRSRELVGRHYVWHDGMAGWQRVRQIPDLARYLAEGLPSAPPPPPPVEGFDANDSPEEATVVAAQAQEDTGATAVFEAPSLEDTPVDPQLVEPEASTTSEAFRAVAEGDADDIELLFDRLPREELHEPQESTGVFINKAGVHDERRRRWGLAALLSFCALGLGAAWATGWISIQAPSFKGGLFERHHDAQAELSKEEVEGDYAGLTGAKDEPAHEDKPHKHARRRRRLSGYVRDSDRHAPRRRGDQGAVGVTIGGLETDGVGVAGVQDSALPSSGVERVEVDRSSFDAAAVERIIARRRPSIRICYERSLKSREHLRGKLIVRLRIAPSGKVARAWIPTRGFSRTVLGRCVVERMRGWVFPRFTGSAEQVEVPFVLERSGR